ncbi:MAG: class I tRNA ligase family protein, partial [Candidatus Heimdallarchaeota archaeon]
LDLQKNKNLIKEYGLDEREVELIYPIEIIELKGFKEFPAKIYCEKHNILSQKDTRKLDLATSENYKEEFYGGILNEKCGKYQGMKVSEAAKQVSIDLIEDKKATKLYLPVTPNLRCKCGEKIIVSILKDQWFLNFTAGDWKVSAFKCLNRMKIVPNKYRLNFENVFNWLEKRPCARKRGLGTKLPFNQEWIIEALSDSTIYMAFYTIIHKLRKYDIKPEQLIPEFFDYIFLEKGEIKELSRSIKIDEKILQEMQTEFLYWYPVDHRHTAIMHISNHLSFFIFHHVAIFPEKHWPKLISLIEPLIVEGQKMGKSKGNVISLADVKRTYGADLFRFYISHNTDFGAYMDFRKKEIDSVRNHIGKFYTFISDKILETKDVVAAYNAIKTNYAKVMLSKIITKFIESEKALEEYNIRKYLQISFYEIFNLVQTFSRNNDDLKDFLVVLKLIYPDWLKILSLTIPHICEELWEQAGNKEFISTEIWGAFNKNFIDYDLEIEFEYINRIIEDILNIKKIVKVKKSHEVYIYTAPKWKLEVLKLIRLEEGNFKKVLSKIRDNDELMSKKLLIPFIKSQINNRAWERIMPEIDEDNILERYKSYIEKFLNVPVIINSEFDPKRRSLKAEPFKPGLYINT